MTPLPLLLICLSSFLTTPLFAATAETKPLNPAATFKQHCAVCHGDTRLGGTGPALLPESLARIRPQEAIEVITHGRVATQMTGFGEIISQDEIRMLADWVYSPVVPAPSWSDADIKASRIQHISEDYLSGQPIFKADPLNLFLVVETGDHHISVLDGDNFEPIYRFPTRFALHGGPKFTEGGRYVYLASRDGWISKFDLWNLRMVSEIRAGINTRNVAVSLDGRHVVVANYLPHTLVLLDGKLNLIKTINATDASGKNSSRVSAVYDAAPRQSFIAALKDIPEVWEIPYSDAGENLSPPVSKLGVRRMLLDDVLDDFFFTQDYAELMGAARSGSGQVVSLDAGKKVSDLPLAGMPHLGSGITWERNGQRLMASTNLKEAEVTVIDVDKREIVTRIPTRGPGFFLRSHTRSPYAFVDSMMSPKAKHILQVIDKNSLKVVKEIEGEPGKTLAHVEFTRDGRHALVSLWENDGAIIVLDAQTLKEIKRIPMRKPVGKYNVWNKINRDEGTSH